MEQPEQKEQTTAEGVVVPTVELSPQAVDKMLSLAAELAVAVNSAKDKYYALVAHIRREQIPPKIVRAHLETLLFNRVRISEILKVANTTEEIYKEYEERTIGFKLALQKTREGGSVAPDAPSDDGQATIPGTEQTPEETKKAKEAAQDEFHAAWVADMQLLLDELKDKSWQDLSKFHGGESLTIKTDTFTAVLNLSISRKRKKQQ